MDIGSQPRDLPAGEFHETDAKQHANGINGEFPKGCVA